MRILGIETSCDETSVAVVEDGTHVLCNVIASSKEAFEQHAGVIPEEAARMQVECMIPVLAQALKQSKSTPESIDAIAVTKGPGLLGSLLVGGVTARALASLWKKPLIGVHHTLVHLSSPWLDQEEKLQFPVLCLSASGGHTDLWCRLSHTKGILIGRTRDDAAGEAFDKGASILGLPYPGGPSIAKAAEGGDAQAFDFPLPLKEESHLDFSFSGLKTSLKYTFRDLRTHDATTIRNLAASYQHAICNHLIDRLKKALHQYPGTKEIHVVGGVSANTHLRSLLGTFPVPVRFPVKLSYCTDNAAMIASAGYFMHQELKNEAFQSFETEASLSLNFTKA